VVQFALMFFLIKTNKQIFKVSNSCNILIAEQ